MPPKGSKRALPAAAKKGTASKKAAKKSVSPVKEPSAITKTAVSKKAGVKKSVSPVKAPSPTKSPTKSGPALKKAAVKKSGSPARGTSSPGKTAVYKTAMTRAARATSVSHAPVEPTRHARSAGFLKRGLMGTEDDDDDSTQPTDEMLAAFGKGLLTDMDRYLIEGIRALEGDKDARAVNRGKTIYKQELAAANDGLPLDCHTKIYWRFNDMFARRNGDYMLGYFGKSSSTAKTAGRAASRSPRKAPSISQEPSRSHRSPERRQAAISRPIRKNLSSNPEPAGHVAMSRVAGPSRNDGSTSRITRTTRTDSSRTSQLRSNADAIGTLGGLDRTTPSGLLDSFEKLTYQMALLDEELPKKPRVAGVTAKEMQAIQNRATRRAQLEIDGMEDEDVDMDDYPASVKGIEAPPAPMRRPSAPKPRLPIKQSAINKVSVCADKAFPDEPGRGTCISKQNPPEISVRRGTTDKLEVQQNPFYETMPAPEVWHRRMPPIFPFGETPFMAKVVSDQINADLSRNHAVDDRSLAADGNVVSRGLSAATSVATSIFKAALSPAKAAANESSKTKVAPSPWALPKADKIHKDRTAKAAKAFQDKLATSRKRPAHEAAHGQQKRQRTARSADQPLF